MGLALAAAGSLRAQVGHDPANSPFRDVVARQSITLTAGRFFGNRAHAGVGLQAGNAFGARVQTGLSGPIHLILGVQSISSKRTTIDTTRPESTRVTGTVPQDVVAVDVSIGLTLTGLKTWHGLAPYVALGGGYIAASRTPVDPSGYRTSSGFSFIPTIGVRARLSRSLMLQVEARDNTIRYEWPFRFFSPADSAGNTNPPPVLDPARFKSMQLTHNLLLTVGLSYNFNF